MWIESIFQQSIMFTSTAAIIASTVVAFPLMYQSAKTGFSIANVQIEESARDLGASEYQVFLRHTSACISCFTKRNDFELRSCAW